MADITMCTSLSCDRRDKCYRALATKDLWQCYSDFLAGDVEPASCEYFWDIACAPGGKARMNGSTFQEKPMSDKLKAIRDERSANYGDFEINMISLTRVIEAMLMQVMQKRVVLPDSFGARVMAAHKMLRECYAFKQDNIDDRKNYDFCGDNIDIGAAK